MTAKIKLSGSCLCAKIKIQAEIGEETFSACHCNSCQTWGGSALLAIHAEKNVVFGGEENISVYSSSEWAERGFCKHCGTHLFLRLKVNQHHYLPLGLFKNIDKLNFTSQIFIDKKPPNYSFFNQTETLTGAEFFAKYIS
ncbi:MAG: GFA family protein [Pseudomonadota bacterium]